MITADRTRALPRTAKKPETQSDDEDQAQAAAINSRLTAAILEAALESSLEHGGASRSVK
jgi:hypothetical protein